jgi:hypothetical protein
MKTLFCVAPLAMTSWRHFQTQIAPVIPVLGSLALAFGIVLLLPYLFTNDSSIGFMDAGIWQLLALSFIAWVLLILMVAATLKFLLENTGLPGIMDMVEHFNTLTIWERYRLYLSLFAFLLVSAGLTLLAIM